ncbi:hypothetical protein ACIQCR_31300 [Streptomyces sp. NPDC093249]|uniref:hypothetical protein n=1 Tax=unclassified Streptomyces TaxID=2593676 RepID=UPI00344DF280
MKPGSDRNLIPRNKALRLIGALDTIQDKARNAAQRWELLDENGHVPASLSYTALLQHGIGAQGFSRDILRLTAGFSRSPHHTTPAGRTVLRHLTVAATMSSRAVSHFAQAAESALATGRATSTDDRYLTNSMS